MVLSKAQKNEDTLVKTYEQGMKNLITTETKLNGAMMKGIASYTKWVSQLSASNKAQIEQTKRTKSDNKIRADSLIVKQKMKDADEHLIKLRSRLRLEEEREHGEQVRRNITLRDKNEGFIASLQFATKSLTGGFGFQAAIGTTVKNFGQLTKKFNTIKLSSESLSKAQQNLQKKSTDLSIARMTQDKPTIKKAEAEYEAAKSEVVSKLNVASEEQVGAGVESKQLKPVFSRLSKLGEFLGKKAVPIGLGIGVAGVIMSVIVKAFSASPLFAQMMKLMKFMVTLILMPIGTFFGALLRPILITLLRKFILPFYSTWMPTMMSLGTKAGTFLSDPIGYLRSGGTSGDGKTDEEEAVINEEIKKTTNKAAWDEFTSDPAGFIWRLFDLPTVDNVLPPVASTSLIGAPTLEDYDPNAGDAGGKFQPKDGGTYDPYAGRPIPEYIGELEHIFGSNARPWAGSATNTLGGVTPSDIETPAEKHVRLDKEAADRKELMLSDQERTDRELAAAAEERAKKEAEMHKEQARIMERDRAMNQMNETMEKYRTTGGIIEDTMPKFGQKEQLWNEVYNKGGDIQNAGANIAAANARNASAGYTMGSSAKSQSVLEAYNAFKNGVSAANGFDGMVNSPTMFLAGEAGAEHVTVTPNGQGGGSNITINIQNMNGSDNDLRKLKKTILEVIQESSANRGRL